MQFQVFDWPNSGSFVASCIGECIGCDEVRRNLQWRGLLAYHYCECRRYEVCSKIPVVFTCRHRVVSAFNPFITLQQRQHKGT